MAARQAGALLIGSGIYEDRERSGGAGGKATSRKAGIRPSRTKNGDLIPPDAWALGDLQNMRELLQRSGVAEVEAFNYKEQYSDNTYALGKTDVLEKIREFFNQEDVTNFVLYYTGHGDGEGSWLFPVTRAVVSTPHNSLASTLAEVERAPPRSREDSDAAAVVVEAEVYGETGDTGGHVTQNQGQTDATLEAKYEAEVVVHHDGSLDNQIEGASIKSSVSTSEISDYTIIQEPPPPPSKKFNDFVSYEDVVKEWRQRQNGHSDQHLVMILDCCHSGKWVQMMNEEREVWERQREDKRRGGHQEEGGEGGPVDAQDQGEVFGRAAEETHWDISIQAACHPSETSMVSQTQLSSVFTKAFVAAQSRRDFEKLVLTALDHLFVLNVVSIASGSTFTPLSSKWCAPIRGLQFFDSFDEMHLRTV